MKRPPLAPVKIDKWGNTVPRYLRVYDNSGQTFDRYTICFTKKRVSGQFMHIGIGPSFYVHGFNDTPIDRPGYSHLGKPISFNDLPVGIRMKVLAEYVELWCGVDDVGSHRIHSVFEEYLDKDMGIVLDNCIGYAVDYDHAALWLMSEKARGCFPVLSNIQGGHSISVTNEASAKLLKKSHEYQRKHNLD